MRLVVLFGLAGWLIAVPAVAGLAWESTTVRVEPVPGADEVRAAFRFQNMGPGDAEIVAVRPGCGCTTAALTKMRYADGEKGEVVVTLTIGDRIGLQRKMFAVWVKNERSPGFLTLEVPLPDAVRMSASVLEWKADRLVEAREITVRPLPEVKIDAIEVTDPAFAVQWTEGKNGDRVVTVLPIDGRKASEAALLRIRYGGKKSGAVNVPLRVR